MSENILSVQNLHTSFHTDKGEVKAVNGVTFNLEKGKILGIVGESGSGKSTIIKLLTGEIVPTSGRVMVNGFSMGRISDRQIPYMRRTIGVIFQDFRLIGNKTVRDNLALAMRAVGASAREIKSRIPYVLELVGRETNISQYVLLETLSFMVSRKLNAGEKF